jgi:hypothetical protein
VSQIKQLPIGPTPCGGGRNNFNLVAKIAKIHLRVKPFPRITLMDKKLNNNSSRNWSEIRSVLFESLPDEIFSKENHEEWLTYHWNLVVGKEISRVSTIDKASRGILYVRVEGKEWVSVLEPLKIKIMQEINNRAGELLLNSIVFKAVA